MKEDITDILREYFNSLDREIDLATVNPVASYECLKRRTVAEQKLRYLSLTDNDVSLLDRADALVKGGDSEKASSLAPMCDTTTAEEYIKRISNRRKTSNETYT